MKKFLLSVFSFALVGTSFSQLSIEEYGTPGDISGTTVTHSTAVALNYEHIFDFEVKNLSGSTQDWRVTRYNVNNPVGWNSQFCWGVLGGIGSCLPASASDYQTSDAVTILADSSGLLSVYITCPNSGTGTYRYYLSTDGINFIDSIDVMVTYALGIEDKPSVSVSIAPNPASDYIVVNTSGINNASVKIVDVLGNLVLDEKMLDSKTNINVAKFRNGVYFVMVEGEGTKAITRKVIVRH